MKHIVTRKAVILSITDEKGGAENLLKLFALNCLKEGINVDVVVLKSVNSTFWVEDGFRVVNIYSFLLKHLFIRCEIDISFSSSIYTNSFIGILSKLGIINIRHKIGRESTRIFSRYSGIKLLVYRLFYFFGYRFLDTLICQNELMKAELEKNLPEKYRPRKLQVINNPLNVAAIKELSNEVISIIEIENSFISVGRLIPEKGFDKLIEAYALNAETLPKLYIIGEGKERKLLENLIYKMGLGNKIILTGNINNPYPMMKKARGCIISSKIEGFPNVLNEMILLNDRVLSSYCVPEVSSMDFILKSSIYDIVDFSNNLVELMGFEFFSKMEAKKTYLESLEPSVFFNRFNQNID
jgi:glycosyltransferase involved in cell wall biosynthesis